MRRGAAMLAALRMAVLGFLRKAARNDTRFRFSRMVLSIPKSWPKVAKSRPKVAPGSTFPLQDFAVPGTPGIIFNTIREPFGAHFCYEKAIWGAKRSRLVEPVPV